MKEITSDTLNIGQLLTKRRYGIDYYQREYVWERTHVTKLVEDLSDNFLKNYEVEHTRPDVKNYDIYFLGTIIISDVGNDQFLVDGQQRLTSLTFLMMALLKIDSFPDDQKGDVRELVYSSYFGEVSYNLDVPDRVSGMEHLMRGTPLDRSEMSLTISNMLRRFADIEANLPDDLLDPSVLPLFIDWLIHRVFFVKITAYSHADAYTMFEAMNDRGLQLTHSELLRGYLLSRIERDEDRQTASDRWRLQSDKLDVVRRGELPHAIRAWLRGGCASSMSEYDSIGNDFNRWVRDHEKDLSLRSGQDFFQFVNREFDFYAHWYGFIRTAADNPSVATQAGLDAVRYNWVNDFTLQMPALLAPLRVGDSETDIYRKLRSVSVYIDCMLMRRIWNGVATFERLMRNRIFGDLITEIRQLEVNQLADLLVSKLSKYSLQFIPNAFGVHQQNRRRVHYMLARFTDYIGTQCDEPSYFEEYVSRGGNDPFEVEHVWAYNYDYDALGFDHQYEFNQYRDRIGGLLLLPKSFNAAFGAKPYDVKCKQYFGQNYLAKSLHENAYELHSRFDSFKQRSGLPFRSHTEYSKTDLDERSELYRQIAMQIWSPDAIRQAAQ